MMTQTVQDLQPLSISAQEIMTLIPHRYPMLMVDRVEEVCLGESAVGIKNVTMNEPFFPGHFPENPVMPGVLIVEAMAQTAAILVMKTLGQEAKGKLVYFMSVEEAKFRKPIGPGDVIRFHVKKQRSRGPVWKFKGWAYVDGVLADEATFTAMIASAS